MASDGFLHRYFLNNAHKLIHKWFHYFDIYERHFQRFRGQSPVVLEIGVSTGGSLAMWKDYFGPGCKIIGLDIEPDCKAHEAEDIEVFIGSQSDRKILNLILAKYPRIDIVIDDGSHIMEDVVTTFTFLYDRVSPRGIYLVEDLHTAYWEETGGGVKREGTFMELVKDRLDEINAVHTRDVVPVSTFTRSTDAICCYDSIVVFERRPQGNRIAQMTYPME